MISAVVLLLLCIYLNIVINGRQNRLEHLFSNYIYLLKAIPRALRFHSNYRLNSRVRSGLYENNVVGLFVGENQTPSTLGKIVEPPNIKTSWYACDTEKQACTRSSVSES